MSEIEELKKCNVCQENKPLSAFEFRKEVGYHRPHCKKCKSMNIKPDRTYKLPTKLCRKCGVVKDIELFAKRKNRNNCPESYCIECQSNRSKKYYYNNIEECKKRSTRYLKKTGYGKEYLIKNRAKLNEKAKVWIKSNRGKINKYQKERYYSDANYNITKKIRVRFYKAVERGSKKSSVVGLLGCSISYFKIYLESKFVDGMTWELFFKGQIHVDHKVPLDAFDLTDIEQQKIAWHYSNLQPLWWYDNLKKGSKYEEAV